LNVAGDRDEADAKRFDFFLSYNRNEPYSRWVWEIKGELADKGFSAFLDEENLSEDVGRELDSALENHIRSSRAILVCIGQSGFGPYQSEEIAFARQLAETNPDFKIFPVLLHDTQHDALRNDARSEWLHRRISCTHPPRIGDKTLDDVMGAAGEPVGVSREPTLQAPEDTGVLPQDSPRPGRLDRKLSTLAETVAENGVAVIIGSSWRETASQGIFDTDELSVNMLGEIGIDSAHAIPIEQAAAPFAALGEIDSAFGTRIRTSLRERMALVPPPAIDEIALLLETLEEQERKPLIAVSLNMDALLERTLLDKGVSFMRVVARPANDFDYTMFWASKKDDQSIEVSSLREHGPGHKSFSSATNDDLRAALSQRAQAEGIEGWDTMRRTSAYRPDNHEEAVETRMNAFTSHLGTSDFAGLDDDIRSRRFHRMAALDAIIEAHSDACRLTGRTDGNSHDADDETTALYQTLQSQCLKMGVPVIVKIYGCIHTENEFPFSMHRIMDATRSGVWLPRELLAKIAGVPTVFAGFNISGFDFHHLLFGHMARMFGNEKRKRPTRYVLTENMRAAQEPDMPKHAASINDMLDAAILDEIRNGTDFQLFEGLGMELVRDIQPRDFFQKLHVALGRHRGAG